MTLGTLSFLVTTPEVWVPISEAENMDSSTERSRTIGHKRHGHSCRSRCIAFRIRTKNIKKQKVMKQYDAIIIGFGKGGKTLAVELAKRNWTVAVIESSAQMYGGTCINIGCIPTKTLVHQAKIAECQAFTSFEEKKVFYRRSIRRKNEVTALLRNKNFHNLADQENITGLHGNRFFRNSRDRCGTNTRKELSIAGKTRVYQYRSRNNSTFYRWHRRE